MGWSEGKDDEAKMNGCLAKAISTWLAVLESEEGLNCLLAAKDNIGKIRACKANGATAQVDANMHVEKEAQEFVLNALETFAVNGPSLGREDARVPGQDHFDLACGLQKRRWTQVFARGEGQTHKDPCLQGRRRQWGHSGQHQLPPWGQPCHPPPRQGLLDSGTFCSCLKRLSTCTHPIDFV